MEISLKKRRIKKISLIVLFFLIVTALIVLVALLSAKNVKLQENNQEMVPEQSWDDNMAELPDFMQSQEGQKLLYDREAYLAGNLSDLSPEKEVLGGSFYLTNISWLEADKAIIEYEDGHIALKAEVAFKDALVIDSFNIID